MSNFPELTTTILTQLVQFLPCGVFAYTLPEHKVLMVNNEAKRLFDYSYRDINAFYNVMSNHILSEDFPSVYESIQGLQSPGDGVRYQFHSVINDGDVLTVDCTTQLLTFENGKNFILSVMQDITESESKTVALNDLTRLQQQIVESLTSGVICYTVPGKKLLLINQKARHILECGPGEDPMEVMDFFYSNKVLPDDRTILEASANRLQKAGDYDHQKFRVCSNTGKIRTVRTYSSMLRLSNGQKVIVNNLFDITEQEQTAGMLRRERKQYRDAVIHNSEYSYTFDVTDNMIYSDFTYSRSGFTMAEMLGTTLPLPYDTMEKRWVEMFQPEYLTTGNNGLTCQDLIELFQNGTTHITVEYYLISEDQYHRKTILLSKDDTTGHIIGVVYISDITDTVREETRQRNELAHTNRILKKQIEITKSFSSMYYASWTIDLETAKVSEISVPDWAKFVTERSGGEYARALDQFIRAFVQEDFQQTVAEFLRYDTLSERLYAHSSISCEYMDKTVGWCLITLIPLRLDETGTVLRAIIALRSISVEKQRELDAKKALQEAYEAANHASVAKTNFMSSMSHDIRTPLNAIIGMTSIAEAHIDDRERVADCLSKITVAGKHLLGLINEVLDMNKIESGILNLNLEEFSLSELVNNLLTMSNPLIEEKGHEFFVNIQNIEHENVIGDSQRIQQVFMNLMSNAVKYTPDGGKISLSIFEKPVNRPNVGCYEFIFEDNGIGMSEEFLPTIFEPFSRAEDPRVSKINGTGLGMPITRNIVNMMNGDIRIESVLNQGTKVTVTIYLELQHGEETLSTKDFEGLRVLVVDDDRISCESTCEVLEELGIRGEWVQTGEEALNRITELHDTPDDYYAVMLDWKMPEMNGLETAKEIRRRAGTKLRIIFVSAYDWSDIEFEARSAGANAFTSKPLFKSRVAHLFRSLLGLEPQLDTRSPLEKFAVQHFAGKRALLVEDNSLNAEIAGEILGMAGLKVEYAQNGKEAYDLLSSVKDGFYDIIFMDIQMPFMNGYEATRAIRTIPKDYPRQVPIIAMTANAFAEDVQAAKNAGMNEHIAKPLDLEQLLRTLSHWLE